MKPYQSLFVSLLLGASLSVLAANTDTLLRPNELLGSDPQYREAWQELIEDEDRLPDWVLNLNGEGPPMLAVEGDGERYLVGRLCEAQRCFEQRLYLAFRWDKERAYALYVQLPAALPKDKAPSQHATLRWLGEPDTEQRHILDEQLKADPSWY